MDAPLNAPNGIQYNADGSALGVRLDESGIGSPDQASFRERAEDACLRNTLIRCGM
jgi:hypothetical protein